VPQEQERTALGSGVIVSKEGHILTNNHVVEDTDKIQVELSDGRMLPAELVGTDAETDIAVLKIAPEKIKALPIGNSDEVKVGQLVFAIGNPLGLQESVTRGIISAKSRVVDDSSLEYFQTDAAINQGNSGGPLVNLHGEIIGINTRIASQSGGSQGLGFAIPSNVARRSLDEILKHGRVLHSYLGVVIRPLPPETAAQAGVKDSGGAQVTQVLPSSPAEKAGLSAGDIVTKMNGREVTGIRDLHNRIAEMQAGAKIDLDGDCRAACGFPCDAIIAARASSGPGTTASASASRADSGGEKPPERCDRHGNPAGPSRGFAGQREGRHGGRHRPGFRRGAIAGTAPAGRCDRGDRPEAGHLRAGIQKSRGRTQSQCEAGAARNLQRQNAVVHRDYTALTFS
jgi:S1-C subfamily serine protease